MNKKLLLLPMSALFVFMMAGMASAAGLDCNVSVLNNVLSRNTVINVTYNNSDNTANNVTAFIELSSASTANSSFVGIGNFTNTSNQRHINVTFIDEYVFRDATNYQIRASCYLNGTKGEIVTATAPTVTGVHVDRSKPIFRLASALVGGKEYAPTQKWTATCANFTSATVQFGSNTPIAMVMGGSGDRLIDNTCSFTGTKQSVPEGVYQTVTFTATDGRNSTSQTLSSIRIDLGIPLKQVAVVVASGGAKTVSGNAGGAENNNLALIVIFGLAAYWYVRRNKRK